jgi:predicted MPP superfamily phosphohydrolase
MSKRNLIVFILLTVILFALVFFLLERKSEVDSSLTNSFVTNGKFDLKIGYITDLHCYSKQNSETGEWEMNWRCSQPLTNFVNMVNDVFKPDVVVEGGDLMDGRDDQERNIYPVVFDFFEKKLDYPRYHILGNHETRGFLKEDWLELTNYEKPYYFKDVKNYRLIFLDGNNKINIQGTSVDTTPELHYYPGHLDPEQKEWLEQTLKTSADKNILVFVHQPPLEKTLIKNSSELFVEGSALRKMFSEYQVKAVISGHIEEMCYVEEGGVVYYTLPGVHKVNRQLLEKDGFKDQGSFYQITVNKEQKLEIKMFHKDQEALEYQSLVVNQETAVCNNQSIKNPEAYEILVEKQEKIEEENDDEK